MKASQTFQTIFVSQCAITLKGHLYIEARCTRTKRLKTGNSKSNLTTTYSGSSKSLSSCIVRSSSVCLASLYWSTCLLICSVQDSMRTSTSSI